MVWFYKRGHVALTLETSYDNDASEYVAIVTHPDGRRVTERFARQDAFRTWLLAFEKRLADDRWAPDGPPHVLPDGWPHKPPLM